MDNTDDQLTPPQIMALTYAKAEFRAAWGLLLNLDRRLFSVVMRGTEPVLVQMRLAWWRDQIAKPISERPRGEPLLAELFDIQMRQPEVDVGHYCQLLVDAWEVLAVAETSDRATAFASFAELRSEAVFASYARWCEDSPVDIEAAKRAGCRWAALTMGQGVAANGTERSRFKPLSILLMAAQAEAKPTATGRLASAFRLQFHALTGL